MDLNTLKYKINCITVLKFPEPLVVFYFCRKENTRNICSKFNHRESWLASFFYVYRPVILAIELKTYFPKSIRSSGICPDLHQTTQNVYLIDGSILYILRTYLNIDIRHSISRVTFYIVIKVASFILFCQAFNFIHFIYQLLLSTSNVSLQKMTTAVEYKTMATEVVQY